MTADPIVVLHVEDDDALRSSVALFLNAEGYRTLSAADGSSAVELVRTAAVKPSVLIVDYVLPGEMDGTDVAQAVCGALGYGVPTIVLSAELANAAVPWIPGVPLFCVWKPIDPEVLLRVVSSFATLGSFLRTRGRLPR
jgi:two-component system CheB/CheR fusion protein